MANDPDDEYWYNIKTGAVEKGMVSPAVVRVGPFATAEEAAGALELIRRRAAEWAAEDAAAEKN